jgi:hypothetical protein
MCGRSLAHRAAVGIKRSGAFQVRRRIPQPDEAAVVKMHEDRSDGPAVVSGSRELRSPRLRVKVFEQELVHCIVGRIGFQQYIANLA